MNNEACGKYDIKREDMVLAKLAEGPLETDYGRFNMAVFHDGHQQAVVLSMGDLTGEENVICRIHSECISAHVFFGHVCDCKDQMMKSQKLIQNEGKGLIIYLEQEGRGSGAAAHTATLKLKEEGIKQPQAYEMRGFPEDTRTFNIAAKVIRFLQIESVILISSNKRKINTLKQFGITVAGTRNLEGGFIPLGHSRKNIQAYIERGIHKPIISGNENKEKKWVLVLGDLIVDYQYSELDFQKGIIDEKDPVMGGTGYNAAVAFQNEGFSSILFGKIGEDCEGRFVQKVLEDKPFPSLVGTDTKGKATGKCRIFYTGIDNRLMIKQEYNANDYDQEMLDQAILMSAIGKGNFIFLVGHPLFRFDREFNKSLIEKLSATGAKMIVDLVPHNMYEKVTIDDLKYALNDKVDILISEYKTLMLLMDRQVRCEPSDNDWGAILDNFNADYFVIRYGAGNISEQSVCKRIGGKGFKIMEQEGTGYLDATDQQKKGFGDVLTAQFLDKYQEEILNG